MLIPIFFAVDDNYAPFLAVALHSLTANADKNHKYKIHILTEGLTDTNKKQLSEYSDNSFSIEFVDVKAGIEKMSHRIHTRDYYTKATYYRFLIADMFPEYDKGLYLDCDIVVNGDISTLFATDISEYLVAAMPEEVMTDIDVYGTYAETVLGVNRFEYFNAGVMLMNLDLLRQVDIQARLMEIMAEYTFTPAQDQDYLNVLCHGSVKMLPMCWNKNAFPGCEDSQNPAKIVHYKINWKPWHYDGVGYEKDFWQYAAQTPYYAHIKSIKDNYSPADVARDNLQFENLAKTALRDTENAREPNYILPLKHTIKVHAEV